MKTISIVLLYGFFSFGGFSQSPEMMQKEAMKKMEWLVGEWSGNAWTQIGPQNRDTVEMHESISLELNGTILKIKGTGYHAKPNGVKEVAHDAFAVVSYDAPNQKYRWQSWRVPGGYFTEYVPEVAENTFSWTMETPRGKMKYKLQRNEKGQWHETGHFSQDGENWFPFFEMLLNKEKH